MLVRRYLLLRCCNDEVILRPHIPPFGVVGFQKDGAIAVLRTGATEFKPAREFTRHVSKLARFFDKYSV